MNQNAVRGTVAALGNFDGLHIGHMAVIHAARTLAEETGAQPCICTFREHPLKVLRGAAPPALMEGELKEELYAATGMDVVHLDFDQMKDLSPEAFFRDILLKQLQVKGVCCGFNFTFGAGGKGTPALLATLCEEAGVAFSVADATQWKGETVSSTRIRRALEEGDVTLANEMLGRPFQFRQRVEEGYGRGHTWGIPTINQTYPKELVLPKFGVYCSLCDVDGVTYYGATNIGLRPTVNDGKAPSAETFLLDYEGDLYGKTVDIRLLEFLRPEQKFPDFDALSAQMRKDVDQVRSLAESAPFAR